MLGYIFWQLLIPHPEKFSKQLGDILDFDNVETYIKISFEFYLDMTEEEKTFVQRFNYYIDKNLKDARKELAKASSKIPEAKYMLALVNYLPRKKTEAKILLTNFSSDWKRFIQTWRIPILVVPFQSSDKNLYISIDKKD